MSITINNNCLQNIIALDGTCAGSLSSSGLYASTLGITPAFLSQIINDQYEDVNDLFNRKKSQAIDIVANTLHTHFQEKYRVVSVVDNFRTGIFAENKPVIASSSNYKGVTFDLCNERSYLDFYLSQIDLFVNYSGTVPVLVIDLMQGVVLETILIEAVAGQIVTVYPSLLFNSNKKKLKLFIGYDTTGIAAYKTTLKSPGTCSTCQSVTKISGSYETITSNYIALTDALIPSSLHNSTDTGGLSITHSLSCNHKDWLCSIGNQLAYPILYKLASLIFEFALTESPNDRINTTGTNNAELLKARYDLAESKYNECMSTIVKTMNVPEDENCFVCKKRSRHAMMAI